MTVNTVQVLLRCRRCRMLIYSDGAYEFYLESGRSYHWMTYENRRRVVRVVTGSLDELVDDLRTRRRRETLRTTAH